LPSAVRKKIFGSKLKEGATPTVKITD